MDELQDMEQAMEINRAEMKKLDKFFSVVYYACMVPSLLIVLLGLCMIVITLVTLGTADVGVTPVMMLKWLASIGAILLFGMSNAKSKRCTAWSIVILLFLCLITALQHMFPLMYLVQAALQGLCYIKYDRVDYLKCQMGYPDFIPSAFVSAVHDNNRRLNDTQVRQQLSENRENRQATVINDISAQMPEISSPEYITDREAADEKAGEIFRQ